jgi:uncharacterized protein (TIGR00255 family)
VVTCEVKQVNHRFLDVWLKLPDAYAASEHRFRSTVSELVRRGRIEVRLTRALKPAPGTALPMLDDTAISRAISALTQLKEQHGIPGVIDLRTLLLFPGLHDTFSLMASPDDAEVDVALRALRHALQAADGMRRQEGAELGAAIGIEVDQLEAACRRIGERAAANAAAVLHKLRERLAELARDVALDERRLAEEAALYADRLDITEELARIGSHVAQLRSFLALDEPVGKRIDFLIQELTREVNTIGSKSRDAQVSHEVVHLKAALERAREQVQNVE